MYKRTILITSFLFCIIDIIYKYITHVIIKQINFHIFIHSFEDVYLNFNQPNYIAKIYAYKNTNFKILYIYNTCSKNSQILNACIRKLIKLK